MTGVMRGVVIPSSRQTVVAWFIPTKFPSATAKTVIVVRIYALSKATACWTKVIGGLRSSARRGDHSPT